MDGSLVVWDAVGLVMVKEFCAGWWSTLDQGGDRTDWSDRPREGKDRCRAPAGRLAEVGRVERLISPAGTMPATECRGWMSAIFASAALGAGNVGG